MTGRSADVEGVLGVLLKVRTRSGLKVKRLGSTEVDVTLLADLPVVRRHRREHGLSTDEAIVEALTRVAATLPPSDLVVVDAVLSLGLFRKNIESQATRRALYADDLGKRRQALVDDWDRLHRFLGVTEVPPPPSVRNLRATIEKRSLGELAERCLHEGSTPPPEAPGTSVVVVGGAVTDVIVVSAEFPDVGTAVQATSFEEHPGGKGLNLAVSARRFGLRARLVAAVGGDNAATEILAYMHQEGLSTEWIRTTPGEANPRALVVVSPTGQSRYLGWMNHAKVALSTLDWEKPRTRQAMTEADAVLVTLEPPVETVQWALSAATRQTPKPLVLLQASPPMDAPQQLYRYLNGVDYLIGREGELRGLLPDPDGPRTVDALAEELLNLGVVTVCVVEHFGCKIRSISGKSDLSGPKVPLDDTPGAREAFSAALTYQLLEHGGGLTAEALDVAINAMTASLTVKEITNAMPGAKDLDRAWARTDMEPL